MIVSEFSRPASQSPPQRSGVRINWARLVESIALLAATAALVAGFGFLSPASFLSWSNISTMLGSQSILVVLSLALIIPLTAGDFDLSIASVMSLSAMVVALLNVHAEWPVGLAIVAGLGVGALTGLINAGFILYFRIPSLIVTLGTSTFLTGLILWISGSNTITGVSSSLVQWIVVTRLVGIPIAFFYALLLATALWYFLEYTTAGRRLLFVGRSREVARLSGISVDRVRLLSFVSSGLISAAAGVMYVGMMGAADPVSGQTFLLPAFAAAFLGATSINPGRFNAWGTFIAVYFLVVGITGLTMLGVDTYVQNLFYGGALVLAVSLSQLVRRREPQDFT